MAANSASLPSPFPNNASSSGTDSRPPVSGFPDPNDPLPDCPNLGACSSRFSACSSSPDSVQSSPLFEQKELPTSGLQVPLITRPRSKSMIERIIADFTEILKDFITVQREDLSNIEFQCLRPSSNGDPRGYLEAIFKSCEAGHEVNVESSGDQEETRGTGGLRVEDYILMTGIIAGWARKELWKDRTRSTRLDWEEALSDIFNKASDQLEDREWWVSEVGGRQEATGKDYRNGTDIHVGLTHVDGSTTLRLGFAESVNRKDEDMGKDGAVQSES